MQFTIEIEDSWLDTLDSFISDVLSEPTSSLESALEFSIFAQIREQRLKPEILRCWYCDGIMNPQTFKTCFGSVREYFECEKCHFDLDRSFVEKYGPARPAA